MQESAETARKVFLVAGVCQQRAFFVFFSTSGKLACVTAATTARGGRPPPPSGPEVPVAWKP